MVERELKSPIRSLSETYRALQGALESGHGGKSLIYAGLTMKTGLPCIERSFVLLKPDLEILSAAFKQVTSHLKF